MGKFVAFFRSRRNAVAAGAFAVLMALIVVAIIATSQFSRANRGQTLLTTVATATVQQTDSATVATATATSTPHPVSPTATARRPTPTPIPATGSVTVVSVPFTASDGTTNVTCPPGTTLVSGGYTLPEGISPFSSYPSSANTWTVFYGGELVAGATGTAYAECLQTSLPITAHIITGSSYTVTGTVPEVGAFVRFDVSCPSGVITGGGYTGISRPMDVDGPNTHNGWAFEELNASSGKVYAICVTGGLSTTIVSNVISAPPAILDSSTNNLTPTPFSFSVGCPSGRLLVGGGLSQPVATAPDLDYGKDQMNPGQSRWNLAGINTWKVAIDATGYAVCAKL